MSIVFLFLVLWQSVYADEGMWMPGHLDKRTRRDLKEMGLQMPVERLCSWRRPSLKDAVVSFGGFCSGVVVSEDGLVFTNHHCGFHSIQQHATPEHDYLTEGFVAHSREEELPNPELYVRFLVCTEDVTRRVLSALRPGMTEMERSCAIDSMRMLIGEEASKRDSTLTGVVDAFYGGNEFFLSVYRDFNDVRLVFAPPSSVGKFGWDKDNWEWPRHTGDFCVFRIYAGRDNRPAGYSPDNVPYHPDYVAPVSMKGYAEGDFCMTMGYPGSTERYLSSFGIEEKMVAGNQARIDMRGRKQAIWKKGMERDDATRIKYAAKYDESSNYWKNSIGVNRAIRRLHVLEKKQALEQELRGWMRQLSDKERTEWLPLLTDLELAYKSRRQTARAQAYFEEAFFNGPELVQQALAILNFDFEGEPEAVRNNLKEILERYSNLDIDMDKRVFVALLEEYRKQVDAAFLPELYQTIDTLYGGEARSYVDALYRQTEIDTPRGLKRFFEQDSTYQIMEDPAIGVAIDLITTYFTMGFQLQRPTEAVERGERMLNAALRRMQAGRSFYPDANSTMRLSFGTIRGYRPADGTRYGYYTTTRGILEKNRENAGDRDFELQPRLLDLLREEDFGDYADERGDMRVCFISDNDITGGNSGSAMFNAHGELIGLAFDGNWEAMSSDLLYEPDTQRCIGVDMRYVLFIIEKYGEDTRLIQELRIANEF